MVRNLTLLFLIASLSVYTNAQNLWGKSTTSQYTNEAIDIETDGNGNSYVAGYFSGGTSFAPLIAQTFTQGSTDIYVAKYDVNGVFQWVKTFGGLGSDKPTDLVLDNLGNIIITGQYFGQITFGSYTLNSVGSSKDIFLTKLDNSGLVLWAKSEGGSGSENAYGLAVDDLNNIILTGQFQGSSLIAGLSVTSYTDPTTGLANFDLFVSKYLPSGLVAWVKTGQAKYEERGLAVACDSQNNIFLTGQFSDTLIFAGTTYNNNAYTVGFVAKLDPIGNVSWFNQMKAGNVVPYDIEVNSADEPVVIGDFLGTMLYNSTAGSNSLTGTYSKKIFALKIANNGNYIWGSALSSENELSARSLSIDGAKNIFITGFFRCSWSQFHIGNTALYNSVGYKDAYLVQFNNLGSLGYAKTFGSQLNDEGHGVAIDNFQKPILCGSFTATLNLPISSTANYSFTQNLPFSFNSILNNIPQPHLVLQGDQSANSFLMNGVNINTPNYNYFNGSPQDTLYGFINSALIDTVNFCNTAVLSYNALTGYNAANQYGPLYSFLWNTGATSPNITISQSGTYSVQVARQDLCASGGDTIVAVHQISPTMPLMTDNLGIADSTLIYPDYILCFPDSVEIYFSNLCQGCNLSIAPVGITDTLAHYYNQAGTYYVNVSNQYCSVNQPFEIEVQYSPLYDSLKPYLYFPEDTDFDDSIVICQNEVLNIHIYDSITNPNAIFNQFFAEPTNFYGFNCNLPLNSNSIYLPANVHHGYIYTPTVSGWHVFTYYASIGFDNNCGLDTTNYIITDSIYIHINTLPVGNSIISATDLLCPNGSVYLTVSPTHPNLNWTGPQIASTSINNDSVQVTASGLYYYSGLLTDTTTGCSHPVYNVFLLNEKQPPLIVTNPIDGIVCPGDSVDLWIPNNYTSYNWTGPDNSNLSNTNTHTDTDAGFYYCEVVDSSGCSLTTTPAEINHYSTPSIYAEPQSIICNNNPVTLNVNYTGNAQILWLGPTLSGSMQQVTVNQPGIYVCQIQQCGITTLDSIEIIDGSFSISLTVDDTLLCSGDTAQFITNSGFNSYTWSSVNSSSHIMNTTVAGSYSVHVVNQYGCEAFSDTIHIAIVPFSEPPNVSDTSVCIGDSLVLTVSSGVPVNWYDTQFNLVAGGTQFSFFNLQNDTLIYASYATPECPILYQEVNVVVYAPFSGTQILGDTLICPLDTTVLTLNTTAGNIEWFVNGIQSGYGNPFSYIGNTNGMFEVVTAIITNICYTDTAVQNVYTYSSPIIHVTDTVVVCGSTNQNLTLDTTYTTITWSSPFGTSNVDTLNVSSLYQNGSIITVQIVDLNGCISNVDSAIVLTPLSNGIDSIFGLSFCTNDSLTLSTSAITDSILWFGAFGSQNGNQVTVALNTGLNVFYLEVIDSLGCIWLDSITINPIALPTLFNFDTIPCFTDWFILANQSTDFIYTDSTGQPFDTLSMSGNQWYYFTITSTLTGCSITDSVFVVTISCSNLVPNVITPNGDGINDFFYIDKAPLHPNNKVIVLNRWGNVVFEMDRYNNQWDGGELTSGVYTYVYFEDTLNPQIKAKHGHLHILR